MPVILVAETEDFSPQVRNELAALGALRFEDIPAGRLADHMAQVEVLWTRLRHRVDIELLRHSPQLKAIVCPVTGLDHIDLEAAAERDIKVLSLKGEVEFLKRIRATAEHTVALCLAILRHLPGAFQMGANLNWERDRLRGAELYERQVGIVGLGRLGSIVAGLMQAFGAEVWGYDPHVDEIPAGVKGVDSLDTLLENVDLVSLHVDLNPSTKHLMDGASLRKMRPGACLVNTSRGDVVDTSALLDALQQGHLGGAALDVLEGELEGEANPVFKRARGFAAAHPERLILTPHMGGATFESTRRTEEFLLAKLQEFLQVNGPGSSP